MKDFRRTLLRGATVVAFGLLLIGAGCGGPDEQDDETVVLKGSGGSSGGSSSQSSGGASASGSQSGTASDDALSAGAQSASGTGDGSGTDSQGGPPAQTCVCPTGFAECACPVTDSNDNGPQSGQQGANAQAANAGGPQAEDICCCCATQP